MLPKKVIAVKFPACGAEFHPAFSAATLLPDGSYLICYPMHITWMRKSRLVQLGWARNKITHLHSWGKEGTIVEL